MSHLRTGFQLNVRVTADLLEKIDAVAFVRGISRQDAVRTLLTEYSDPVVEAVIEARQKADTQ